jgi:hypothetical protein
MKRYLITCFVCILCAMPVHARKRLERQYQYQWCVKECQSDFCLPGFAEVRLADNTRCDCIKTINGISYAIEFDFAAKWTEAVSQALHYSIQTGSKPGIVLIIEQPKDYVYLERLRAVLSTFNLIINVWVIENIEGL